MLLLQVPCESIFITGNAINQPRQEGDIPMVRGSIGGIQQNEEGHECFPIIVTSKFYIAFRHDV
jgi:hypothetical protein